MTKVGILTFDIYNQDGRNELNVNGAPNALQKLKLRIQNSSADYQIKFPKEKQLRFVLRFKKGLLPSDFDVNQIQVTKWRHFQGKDIFDQSKLQGLSAFDIENLKNKLTFDVSSVIKKLDDFKVQFRGLESQFVQSEFDDIISAFKNLGDDEATTKFPWINELEDIKDLYAQSLTDLRSITQTDSSISNNPLLSEGFEKLTTVFTGLAQLHQRTRQIVNELEAFTIGIQKQQVLATNDLYDQVKQKFAAQFAPFVENLFDTKEMLSDSLGQIKMSDIVNVEQITLNEEVVQKLDGKVMTKEPMVQSDWQIKKIVPKNNNPNNEEIALKFIYPKGEDIFLNPGDYVLFEIEIKGTLEGQAESINVQLKYPNAQFFNAGKQQPVKNKFSKSIVNLKHFGTLNIPVPVELQLLKGRKILNDGQYNNSIDLLLFNPTGNTLKLSKGTTFYLNFDVQQSQKNNYALTTKDLVSSTNVNMVVTDAGKMQSTIASFNKPSPNDASAVFSYTFQKKHTIGAGRYWQIQITNLRTNVANGFSPIQFSILNSVEYNDTQNAVLIERSNQGLLNLNDQVKFQYPNMTAVFSNNGLSIRDGKNNAKFLTEMTGASVLYNDYIRIESEGKHRLDLNKGGTVNLDVNNKNMINLTKDKIKFNGKLFRRISFSSDATKSNNRGDYNTGIKASEYYVFIVGWRAKLNNSQVTKQVPAEMRMRMNIPLAGKTDIRGQSVGQVSFAEMPASGWDELRMYVKNGTWRWYYSKAGLSRSGISHVIVDVLCIPTVFMAASESKSF